MPTVVRRPAGWTCVATAACLLALAGCVDRDPDDPGIADDDTYPDASVVDIQASVSEIVPTALSIRWIVNAEEAEAGWIEYGPDESYGSVWPGTSGESSGFRATLIGFAPSTVVHYRAVAVVGGEELYSNGDSVVTGPLPSDLPVPSLAALEPAAASGGYLVTSINTVPPSVAILDAAGEVVWWYTPDETSNVLFISRALLARDRRSVLYLSTPDVVEEGDQDDQWIVEVSLDGTVMGNSQVKDAHHDFLELSDGNLAVLENDIRPVGEELIKGDRIVERGSDGSKTVIFSVWDHLTYVPEAESPFPADEWTHGNALDLDEEEGAYYLSSHHLNSILKVDRATGDLLWQAGGDDSDFALVGGSTVLFQRQHQFQPVDGGVLVFDNGPPDEMLSRAVQYDLDEDAQLAEEVWAFEPDPALWIYCLGDVSRLPNGNTLITWGTSGRIEEVTPEGETVLQIDLPLGAGFGYTSWTDSLLPVP